MGGSGVEENVSGDQRPCMVCKLHRGQDSHVNWKSNMNERKRSHLSGMM
jgi:hypothetical protein